MYVLPQAGMLASKLIEHCLIKHIYHEVPFMPGLWKHIFQPIQFTLVVNDFGMKMLMKNIPATFNKTKPLISAGVENSTMQSNCTRTTKQNIRYFYTRACQKTTTKIQAYSLHKTKKDKLTRVQEYSKK